MYDMRAVATTRKWCTTDVWYIMYLPCFYYIDVWLFLCERDDDVALSLSGGMGFAVLLCLCAYIYIYTSCVVYEYLGACYMTTLNTLMSAQLVGIETE